MKPGRYSDEDQALLLELARQAIDETLRHDRLPHVAGDHVPHVAGHGHDVGRSSSVMGNNAEGVPGGQPSPAQATPFVKSRSFDQPGGGDFELPIALRKSSASAME